jgi:hypothetical protein
MAVHINLNGIEPLIVQIVRKDARTSDWPKVFLTRTAIATNTEVVIAFSDTRI